MVAVVDNSKRDRSYFYGFPEDFLEILKNGKCILMIGAGISRKCIGKNRRPLPNWFEFLESFTEWKKRRDELSHEDYKEILQLLENGKYPLVAEELIESLPPEDFGRYLDDSFEPRMIIPSYLHDLIPLLPFRGIITTNYDNLIERAYVRCYERLPKVFSHLDIEEGVNVFEHEFFIVKLHGDIEDPQSIVLSQKSYASLLYNSPKYREFLEKVFADYSILFIGYGGNDPDIESTLDRISVGKDESELNQHFMLVKEGNLTNIERRRLLKDKGIRITEYVDYFNLHNHVDTFMRIMFRELAEEGYQYSGAIPKELRTRITVVYDDVDREDGEFLWNYIFKRGAITWSEPAQINHLEKLIHDPSDFLKFTDFLIVFVGQTDTQNPDNPFVRVIRELETNGYHTIIISLDSNKSKVKELFGNLPLFYVPSMFSEVDLKTLDDYIAEKLS